MGLLKGILFETWPFWVSIYLKFWGRHEKNMVKTLRQFSESITKQLRQQQHQHLTLK